EHNTKLVEENEKILEYLQTIKQSLRFCTEADDLQQIREELVAMGLVRENGKQKHKETPMRPLHYLIDGHDVFVGKNNLQNSFVTFKLAKQEDVWLHTQKIHSSHVAIIKGNHEILPQTILQAAEICAYYSQASDGTKIAVDYTPRQNVKRPNGAAPGFAVYNVYKTVIVNPNRHPELLV
ncbi:MAG: NFACT RNA binding domain-containing protein, partial [Candidatus Fimimonas sp.]